VYNKQKQNMTNIIIQNIKGIMLFIANYQLNSKLNTIKNETILKKSESVTITSLFNLIYNYYHKIFLDKGLKGVYNARTKVRTEINELSWDKMSNKTLTVKEINKSFPYLRPFKDILIKIKYTTGPEGEILLLIKAIMLFLSSAALIPIVVLFIYIIIRNILLFTSAVFTTSFAPVVISNGGHNFMINIRNFAEYLSITFHNWLFSDNLKPSHQRIEISPNPPMEISQISQGDEGEALSSIAQDLIVLDKVHLESTPILTTPIPTTQQVLQTDKVVSWLDYMPAMDLNLISESEVKVPFNFPICEAPPVKQRIWDYIPTAHTLGLDWVDWTLVGYTAGALIIVSASVCIYSEGRCYRSNISIKRVGGLIAAWGIGSVLNK